MENIEKTNTEVVENVGSTSVKMFTQEQVNEIVRERLKKVKTSILDQEELDKKLEQVTNGEKRLTCREYLIDNGYDRELLDILDTNDIEKFKNSADKLHELSRRNNLEVAPLASTEMNERIGVPVFPDDSSHKPKNQNYF